MQNIVIIGGSDAGISAALRIRELNPAIKPTLIVADKYPNFSICGLPYYISREVADGGIWRTGPNRISKIKAFVYCWNIRRKRFIRKPNKSW
jgi:NADPH-dependent 2,4-dienoyl-CoA reductase/sulfur reductase-like enzyme